MIENQDSLVEIAIKEMSKKRRPRTLASIAKDVFEIKGLTKEEAEAALPQFQIDFMLCGNFICCGEDRKGAKIWDLKSRQPSSLLDKEGVYLEDPYDDDDDDDEEEEKDDIEEELLLYEEDDDDDEDDENN